MYLFTFSLRASFFDVIPPFFVANHPRGVKATIRESVSFLHTTGLKWVQSRCNPSLSLNCDVESYLICKEIPSYPPKT